MAGQRGRASISASVRMLPAEKILYPSIAANNRFNPLSATGSYGEESGAAQVTCLDESHSGAGNRGLLVTG